MRGSLTRFWGNGTTLGLGADRTLRVDFIVLADCSGKIRTRSRGVHYGSCIASLLDLTPKSTHACNSIPYRHHHTTAPPTHSPQQPKCRPAPLAMPESQPASCRTTTFPNVSFVCY